MLNIVSKENDKQVAYKFHNLPNKIIYIYIKNVVR